MFNGLFPEKYLENTVVDIRPTFNGVRGASIKDKARRSSPSTSVAIAMPVTLCSSRKNQTLLL